MPTPTLESATPQTGATNVAKNISIQAVFDTALAPSSVSNRTVILKYTALPAEIVAAAVSLSTDGLTITIVPAELLIPNSAYQLTLVGNDVSTTVRITASDGSPLLATQRVSFQTGDSLQADATTGLKIEEERDLEGNAVLPDDVGFRATAGVPLRLLRVSPANHSFGISLTTERVRLQFSRNVDPSTITGNITVLFSPFYDEEDYLAVPVDIDQDGELEPLFKYELDYYTGGDAGYLDPAYFEDPDYTLTATGQYVDIEFTPVTGDYLPYNMCIQVEVGQDVADIDGNPLSQDLLYMTCTEPYPNWASVGQVRHEVGAYASSDTPDDFIGLRIWQASIDVWSQLLNTIDLMAPTRYHMMYVRTRAAIDTFDDLMALKYLNSGVVKELGDLRIQYNTGAGGARPRKVKELEERLAKLYLVVFGGWTQKPRTGVRSENDPFEPSRAYFRDRLWRAELVQNQGEGGLVGKLAANTAYTRRQGGADASSWVFGRSR